jgi:hypothetical protein
MRRCSVSKFTRRPKGQAAPGVDDFIGGALQQAAAAPDAAPYPWEDAAVRGDVLKVYNLRLPEAYLVKLRYIAENTPDSMQRFCLGALLPAIDAKIAELTE